MKPINNDQLIIVYLRHVQAAFDIHSLNDGSKLLNIPIPLGSIYYIACKRDDTELFFGFTSPLTDKTIYRLDFKDCDRSPTVAHETIVGEFDASEFENYQVFYKTKDGTKIPLMILHKKSFKKDGTQPCYLDGYGGFGISLSLFFLYIFLGVC